MAQVGTTAATSTVTATTTTVTNTATTATSTPSTTAATTTATAAPTTTTATSAPTTPPFTTTQVIEWDITGIDAAIDGRPGAITVDLYGNGGQKVWFTTRDGSNPRVYMFRPPQNYKYGSAQWNSWTLDPSFLGAVGGIRRLKSSWDPKKPVVFVRTTAAVQKVDTVTNIVTSYEDASASMVSDIAVDNRNFVYSAADGILKRLNASATSCTAEPCPAVEVTQWNLSTPTLPAQGDGTPGSTAGTCNAGPTIGICLAGVAVHPKYQNLVYVAEPGNNTIVEVDTMSQSCYCSNGTSRIRRWNLGDLGVGAIQPRQINFDQDGILWIITGGDGVGGPVHLVSLDPKSSRLAAYQIPPGVEQDTFGVAPDGGMIGYTSNDASGYSGAPEHKVGLFVPKEKGKYICPTTDVASRTTLSTPQHIFHAVTNCGSAPPNVRQVRTGIARDPSDPDDGLFVEAFINQNAQSNPHFSMVPLGITPAFDKAVGSFFYAVGTPDGDSAATVNRLGYGRLRQKGFKAKHEREDKDCNDDGSGQEDEDHDGVPNRYKTNDSKAKMDRQNDQLAPGQSTDYTVTATPNTLALVAAIQADTLTAPVSVQVIDPSGNTLVPAVPSLGAAVATIIPSTSGDYTIRVKNEGALPINHETQLITREPLSVSLP
jgi:hypothetical protein